MPMAPVSRCRRPAKMSRSTLPATFQKKRSVMRRSRSLFRNSFSDLVTRSPELMTKLDGVPTAKMVGSLTSLRTNEPFVRQAVRSHWRVRLVLTPTFTVSELPRDITKLRSVLEYQPGTVAARAGVAAAAKSRPVARHAARKDRFIGQSLLRSVHI